QAEDGIRDKLVTGVQTCALPIWTLDAEDLVIVRRASGNLVVKEEAGYFAAIDPVVSPELRAEGLAREIVSRIQRMRKEAGLAVRSEERRVGKECRCGGWTGC